MEFALLWLHRTVFFAAVAMYLCALNIVSYATGGSNQSSPSPSPLMQHDNTKKTTTTTSAAIIGGHRWWQGLHFNVSLPSATNQVVNYAKVVNCEADKASAPLRATLSHCTTLHHNCYELNFK